MTNLLMSWLAPILGGLATAWALTTFTSLPKWSILLLTLLTRLTRNPRPTHQLPVTDRPAHPHPKNDPRTP